MAYEVVEVKKKKNPWIVTLPTIGAAFMFVLDETIANVALLHMAGSFCASRDESMWIITSYLIASGIIIPAVDWFSKLFGRKNFFMLSIFIFTVASFLCGISNSLEMMVFMRVLQGLGGGSLLPLSQSILMENFPPQDRGKAMAAFGLVIVMAPIVGPVLGGWLTDNWSWPWIFFINIPIGLLTLFLVKTCLEDPPYAKKQDGVKIDAIGFSLLIVWLVTLQVVLDKGNNADWFNAPWICWFTGVSVVSAILFVVSQLVRKEPLVNLDVFADKNYAIGTAVQIVMNGVLLASLAILPQFLQSLMGYDAYLSGLSMMPRGAGGLLGIIICGSFSNKIDNRLLVVIGLFLIGSGSLSLGMMNLQISMLSISVPNFVIGVGLTLAMIPIISLSFMTLKNEQMTNASGVQNLLKNIGGAIGTSIAGTMISRYSQAHQYCMVSYLNPVNSVYTAKLALKASTLGHYFNGVVANHLAQYSIYGDLVKQATLCGFMDTFRICGVAALVIIPSLFFLDNIDKAKVHH